MNTFQQEQISLKKRLAAEVGNSFFVNQFKSVYPKPSGKLISVSKFFATFKSNADGATLTLPHYLADLLIWGK